jgi:Holliday junction resolvase-like predicted endonuclease
LEEIIIYQLQQHVLELGESDRLLQEEQDRTLAEVKALQKECRQAEKAIADAKQKRMDAFEDYALGKSKSYDGSANRLDELRKSYEEVKVKLSEAEVKAAEYDRRKVHESFAVLKLTPELLDEYVESIEVHTEDDVRIVWK